MDLAERVAELERRLSALERADSAASRAPGPGDSDLWALEGLKAKLAEGEATHGGVLFTGAVRLPTNERYEWQYGQLAETLLDEDWSEATESLAALGQPVRMRLLQEILRGRRTVADLAALEGVGTTGQIYHHLRQLTAAGWLHAVGRGRYQVPPGRVIPLLVVLAAARP